MSGERNFKILMSRVLAGDRNSAYPPVQEWEKSAISWAMKQLDELAELRAKTEAQAVPVAGSNFPHEEMDVIALNRYRTEPTDSNIWGWCVRAGDGERELYKGRKSDCDAVARKLIGAFLDGAWLANEKLNAAPPAQAVSVPGMQTMIDRFLSWKLPRNFCPDAGVSFKPSIRQLSNGRDWAEWPSGTNLLNAEQAREMLEYVLAAKSPEQPK